MKELGADREEVCIFKAMSVRSRESSRQGESRMRFEPKMNEPRRKLSKS